MWVVIAVIIILIIYFRSKNKKRSASGSFSVQNNSNKVIAHSLTPELHEKIFNDVVVHFCIAKTGYYGILETLEMICSNMQYLIRNKTIPSTAHVNKLYEFFVETYTNFNGNLKDKFTKIYGSGRIMHNEIFALLEIKYDSDNTPVSYKGNVENLVSLLSKCDSEPQSTTLNRLNQYCDLLIQDGVASGNFKQFEDSAEFWFIFAMLDQLYSQCLNPEFISEFALKNTKECYERFSSSEAFVEAFLDYTLKNLK